MSRVNIDPEYVKRRVAETCAAQGIPVEPPAALVEVIAAMLARPIPAREAAA